MKQLPALLVWFKAKLCVVGAYVCIFVASSLWTPAAQGQELFGSDCPDSEQLIQLTDLLFSTGFICESLDEAFHAAYDPWQSPTGPAPFRSNPAGIAATISRLVTAGDFDGAFIQLSQMPDTTLKASIEAAITLSQAGTVEALFLADDAASRAFRIGNGFDWPQAEILVEQLRAEKPSDAHVIYRNLILGAILGAAERESEPVQSIGWTQLPLWSPTATDDDLKFMLADMERATINFGDSALLYLRLGARQRGFSKLNEGLFDGYYADACKPRADWAEPAKQSLGEVLEMDKGCGGVADFALRDWDLANSTPYPAPAWPLVR